MDRWSGVGGREWRVHNAKSYLCHKYLAQSVRRTPREEKQKRKPHSKAPLPGSGCTSEPGSGSVPASGLGLVLVVVPMAAVCCCALCLALVYFAAKGEWVGGRRYAVRLFYFKHKKVNGL